MEQADSLLSHSIFKLAGASVTLGAILQAVLILVAVFGASWLVKRVTRRMQSRIGDANASAVYISGQILRYVVIFAGIAVAISALGFDLSALSLFAGALGIGIGLGLQDIVKNFVCGLILLFDRGIEVGDFIELEDGTNGEVTSIGARATGIRGMTGAWPSRWRELAVPARFWSNQPFRKTAAVKKPRPHNVIPATSSKTGNQRRGFTFCGRGPA